MKKIYVTPKMTTVVFASSDMTNSLLGGKSAVVNSDFFSGKGIKISNIQDY